MAQDKDRLMKRIQLTGKLKPLTKDDFEPGMEMMLDPRYLRQSSALINEALQKGFDVLQLADGSIVTTGTKTVVYQYSWDAEKGKLVRTKSESSMNKKSQSPARKPMIDEDDADAESDDISPEVSDA